MTPEAVPEPLEQFGEIARGISPGNNRMALKIYFGFFAVSL
jgi:hypothetical protein